MNLSAQGPGFNQLSVAERLRLIEEIWDSIPDFPEETEVPESHKEELDRRLVAMKADPTAGSSWQEVKARLLTERGEPR